MTPRAKTGDRTGAGSGTELRRDKGELGFAGFLLALGVFIVVDTGNIRVPATANAVGPRFFPYFVGTFLIVIAVVLLVQVWRGVVGQPEEGEDVDAARHTDWRTVALLAAVFLGHIALIEPTGWVVATAVLFFGTAWVLGARKPVRAGLIAITVAVVVYVVFDRVLGVSLPGGILEGVI